MRRSSSKNLRQARSRFLGRSNNNNNPRSNGYGNAETPSQEAASSTERYPTFNSMAIDATEEQAEKEDRDQSEWLSKNDDYTINPSVHSVSIALGCDKGPEMDASVALFDERLEVVDTISHYKPQSTCETVEHSRKNGPGERTDEVISVALSKIPVYIHYLLFVFCIASDNASFSEIHSAYVGMMYGKETHQNRKLCRFSVTGMSGHAMIMGVLTRKGPRWNFRALGIPASGRTIQELLQNPKNLECLNAIPSYNPRMRQVTVNVVKGTDLAAKYVLGIFRSPYSSSPYFNVTFKNKDHTSEHMPMTLEPEWKEFRFEMGLINEVETEALKVQIFDCNACGTNKFMGMIQIPGHKLYNLGVGDHTSWFELERSKEEKYRNKKVSGKILVNFRIEESPQDFARSLHPSVESKEIDQNLQNSSTRLGIENTPEGRSLVKDATLGRELKRAIVPIFRKNSVPVSDDPVESTPQRIVGQVALRSEKLLENTSTEAISETQAGRKASLESTHWETPTMMDLGTNPKQTNGPEDSHGTSDGDNSSSSEGELWIPDEPFSSRDRVLGAVSDLKKGQEFADDYIIGQANFAGRPHLRLAKQRFGNRVLLKFYWEKETLDNAIEMHSLVSGSEYVCRILQTLKTRKTGHPSCIAFEKGTQTLRDWLLGDRPMFDRKWCLCQILTGLMEIHDKGVVHCDLKPSNVVLFPQNVTWRFIDFDGAKKAGESRAVCFTTSYAAPEVLQEWKNEGELPVAQPSSDIWSFGIIAYEVLLGERMFGDLSNDEISEFVLAGRIEEKLDSIKNDSHREAISNFLRSDPKGRVSAADGLQHPFFHSDPQTTWIQR